MKKEIHLVVHKKQKIKSSKLTSLFLRRTQKQSISECKISRDINNISSSK